MRTRPLSRAAAGLLLLAALPGCGRSSAPPQLAASPAVVVASFNFAESALVAEIYAQALESAGVPVRRQLDLGPRELVLPALRQGLVDVVPEYLGSALSAVDPVAPPARDAATARGRLQAALRGDQVAVLAPAPAQNVNGLAVTRATAERLQLRTTSDLRAHAAELTLTGPVECPLRPYCLPGLRQRYGLQFRSFTPYADESERVTALEQGIVDVALVFTTDGVLAERSLVLLADDRRLQPDEQLVPVVSQRALRSGGERVRSTLDAVSAQLTSSGLRFLNWRVAVAGRDPRAEAGGWLRRHGLAGHAVPLGTPAGTGR